MDKIKLHDCRCAALRIDEAERTRWLELSETCPLMNEMLHYHATHDPQTALPNLDLLIVETNKALNTGKIGASQYTASQ